MTSAEEIFHLWKHVGYDECVEQIEAHLESAGLSQDAIDGQIQKLANDFDAEFGI